MEAKDAGNGNFTLVAAIRADSTANGELALGRNVTGCGSSSAAQGKNVYVRRVTGGCVLQFILKTGYTFATPPTKQVWDMGYLVDPTTYRYLPGYKFRQNSVADTQIDVQNTSEVASQVNAGWKGDSKDRVGFHIFDQARVRYAFAPVDYDKHQAILLCDPEEIWTYDPTVDGGGWT